MKHITIEQYVELEVMDEVRKICQLAFVNELRVNSVSARVHTAWRDAIDTLHEFEYQLAWLGRGYFDPPGMFHPNLPVEWPSRRAERPIVRRS
jgi:hypothetical protein